MSPELSYGRHAGPAPHTARQAAVMLLLFRRDHPRAVPVAGICRSRSGRRRWRTTPVRSACPAARSTGANLRARQPSASWRKNWASMRRLSCWAGSPIAMFSPATFWSRPGSRRQDSNRSGGRTTAKCKASSSCRSKCCWTKRAIGRLTIERGPLAFHAPCIRVGQCADLGRHEHHPQRTGRRAARPCGDDLSDIRQLDSKPRSHSAPSCSISTA